MDGVIIFAWGFAGSFAIEVLDVYQIFQNERFRLPRKYRLRTYWCIRLCLAVLAGGLAMAYDTKNPALALAVGASAPLILTRLASGGKNDPPPPPAAAAE